MKYLPTNLTVPEKLSQHKISFFPKDRFFYNSEKTRKMVACYTHNAYPLDMHTHDFFEINIITKGLGVHYFNNKKVDVHPGIVFLIPRGASHGYVNLGELEIYHVILPDMFFEKYNDDFFAVEGFSDLFFNRQTEENTIKIITLDKPHFLSVLNCINESLNFIKNDVCNNLLQTSAVCQLILKLCLYSKNNPVKEKNNLYVSLIIDVIHYMKDNLSQKITIDDICKKFYIPKSTFIRAFTKYTCFSPITYLTKLRIEKAKNLLIKTDSDITSIALECGFFDSSHLERYFRQYESCTPSNYRKKHTK